MKVQIRDKGYFDRLNPADVAAYLRAAHWHEVSVTPGTSSTWAKKVHRGQEATLLLPIDRTYHDFALRMADLVGLIAAVEDRSQLAVVDDIQTASADVVRIQLELNDAQAGTISAERGAAVYDNIPAMFSAGACAASQGPQVCYAPKKARVVQDYLRQLRLGQTELGSYVVRVYAPVPPVLEGLFGPAADEPFERLATVALMRGLSALRTAADASLSADGGKAFESAVALGVSANLCDAVARIAGDDQHPRELISFRLTPARTRPVPADVSLNVAFPGDRIPIIREAARVLRERAPEAEQRIRGYVIKLQKTDEKATPAGPVTISTIIEGRQRKVSVHLPQDEHRKAMRAYEQGLEIAIRGILKKTGQLWTLQDPGKLSLLEET